MSELTTSDYFCLALIFGTIILALVDILTKGAQEIEEEQLARERKWKKEREKRKQEIYEKFKDRPDILHGEMYGHLFGYDEVTKKLMEARKEDEERNKWHF